jgi:hypothetical protein
VPTRKQRRRREKEQRHEYEIVYVDDEGHEVAMEEAEVARPASRAKPKSTKGQAAGRRQRTIDPPSWRRSLRRGLIFAPLFLGMILLLNGSRQSLAFSVINTLVLLLVFVPFSYFLDRVFYRTYQKRIARAGGS